MQLNGPVEAETRAARLHAGKLTLTLTRRSGRETCGYARGRMEKTPNESSGADSAANL